MIHHQEKPPASLVSKVNSKHANFKMDIKTNTIFFSQMKKNKEYHVQEKTGLCWEDGLAAPQRDVLRLICFSSGRPEQFSSF